MNPQEADITTQSFDCVFRLVLIGDSAVGKSCLLQRFANNRFEDSHVSTIGVDFLIKTISLDNKIIKLQLWDTAGQERFRTITTSFYRGANGVIVVYDVTNQSSFDAIQTWVHDIDRFAAANVPTLLVGNKSDRETERVISTEQGQALADSLGMRFMETSAKTAVGVEDAFLTMATQANAHVTDRPNRDACTIRINGPTTGIDTSRSLLGRNCC